MGFPLMTQLLLIVAAASTQMLVAAHLSATGRLPDVLPIP